MKTEFDVIIAGAGVNGITVGAYLQKAGLDVAIVERRNECGPYAMTEEIFGRGIGVDTCANQAYNGSGPPMKDLELERFGVEYVQPDPHHVPTWKDGKNLAFYVDARKTAQAIERFSKKDAETFLRIAGGIGADAVQLLEIFEFTPFTKEKMQLLWGLAKYAGFRPDDFRTMNAFDVLDILFENDYVKLAIMSLIEGEWFGNPRLMGEGSTSVLWGLVTLTGLNKGGMHHLPHALVRCFKHYGGTLFLNAPVEKVIYEGGVARGVVISDEAPYPEHELKARHAVVIHLSPQVALSVLGEETVRQRDPDLALKMQQWLCTSHNSLGSFFLLKGLPPWKSASWNPDIMKSHVVMRAWDSWEHCVRSMGFEQAGDISYGSAAGEIFIPAQGDPTRFSSEGYCVLNFEMEYPPLLWRYGGVKRWDDKEFTDAIHRQHTEVMEELAPGFKELIIDSKYFTMIDNWRKNASAILGHEVSGDFSGDQWYMGRMPHRTPIPHVYFSQCAYPLGFTDLAAGYVAAGVVAEDLGVRKQPWWTSRPLEFWFEKFAKQFGLG